MPAKKPAAKNALKKKRGLNEEEKMERALNYFHEQLQPFTMKDLIKLLPKAKGIVFNSVEEAVKMLVAEDKVRQDKVGVSTLLWSFPSDLTVKLENKKSKQERTLSETIEKNDTIQKRIREIEEKCPETENRTKLLKTVSELKQEDVELSEQLQQSKLVDPEYLSNIAASARWFIKHNDRWVDNIHLLLRHTTQQHNMSRKDVMEAVGLCDSDILYQSKR